MVGKNADNSLRLNMLCDLVANDMEGNCTPLVQELDAMHGMLMSFASEFADERDHRMAIIAGMVADLAAVIAIQSELRNREAADADK